MLIPRGEEYIGLDFKTMNPIFLLGAGISFLSGIPGSDTIKQIIEKNLPIDSSDRQLLNDVLLNTPLEMLFSLANGLLKYKPIKLRSLMIDFMKASPNINHFNLAGIAQGKPGTVFLTTNYDICLENALEILGLQREIDFSVEILPKEDTLPELRLNDKKTRIIKLHGSADEWKSTLTSIEDVTSNLSNFQYAKKLIDIFAYKDNRPLLILGYSFSDKYDINSILKLLREGRRPIIYIKHENGKTPYAVQPSENSSHVPLLQPEDFVIIGDTSIFIQELFFENNIICSFNFESERKHAVNESNYGWLQMDKGNGYVLAGRLFRHAGKNEESKKYFNRGSLAVNNFLTEANIECILESASFYSSLDEAYSSYNSILELLPKLNRNNAVKFRAYIGLMDNSLITGKISKASEYLELAKREIKYVIPKDKQYYQARYYHSAGNLKRFQDNTDKELENYSKAMKLAFAIGNIELMGISLFSISQTYYLIYESRVNKDRFMYDNSKNLFLECLSVGMRSRFFYSLLGKNNIVDLLDEFLSEYFNNVILKGNYNSFVKNSFDIMNEKYLTNDFSDKLKEELKSILDGLIKTYNPDF